VLGPLNSLVWYVPSLRYTHILGWCIHCCVEVTESSTNKQHIPSESIDNIPAETVMHIQSAGCKTQKKTIIWAHNRCWKYLLVDISKPREAKGDVEFIGKDKDRQPQRLLDINKASQNDKKKITKMEIRKTTKK
jgi:hypothetical protein